MDLNTAWEQLMLLREQTKRTGALHEAQVLQLRMWPRVFFQRSTSSEFAVDINEKRIVFTVVTGKQRVPGDIGPAKSAVILSECVKKLLGSDWDVDVKVGSGKRAKVYEFPGVVKDDGQAAIAESKKVR